MPEIKHQFTGGKMNKDLDERLVPNGEYRDAMNIQVSTSEGSDVGTAQNILGNSLVPGQGFIGEGAFCVGSIADEKNDKIYYFIDDSTEMLQDTNVEDSGIWNVSGNSMDTPDFSSTGALVKSLGSGTNLYPQFYNPSVDLIDGQTYEVKVKFSQINQGGHDGGQIKAFVYGVSGGVNGYRPYYDTKITNGTHSARFAFDQSLNNDVASMRFSVELHWGHQYVKKVRVESVSLKKSKSSIIEYDSKTNSITPVLVDTNGEVLQFSPDRLITGINVIDGMLFWTDNYSEPKKINIQRCIDGTDPSGYTHTEFVNKETGFATAIKEEHITVIRSGPTSPLGLAFLNPLDRDGKIFAGQIITTASNTASSSSFMSNVTQSTSPYDFSAVAKDDILTMEIPLDEDGTSGFELDWKEGDVLVFKEFDEDGVTPPVLPLSTWTVRAVIQDWSGNKFKDDSDDVITNGNFDTGHVVNMDSWGFNYAPFSTAGY
tara:strand:- start:19 stop:1476 length:1458 start_codon:yes stop_codon:yes gene_type:complete